MEVRKIGMNAITATMGEPSPTTATMKPSVAARLYAGAVEATPMTVAATSPRAPPLRPFTTCCSAMPGGAPAVAIAFHLHLDAISNDIRTRSYSRRVFPWAKLAISSGTRSNRRTAPAAAGAPRRHHGPPPDDDPPVGRRPGEPLM